MPLPSSPELDAAYDALLAEISRHADVLGDRLLTSHWPVPGSNSDHGVLVIGQAVFGWITEWTAPEVVEEAGRRRVLEDTKTVLSERSDPMSWLAASPVRTSPFWRTAHDVVDDLAPGTSDWFSRGAWANLYPIAPNDVKANPGGPLLEVQARPAARVLRAAIDLFDPALVLMLTGSYVNPFVPLLGLDRLEHDDRPLLRSGLVAGRPWIVGWHPGGAQRRGWPARAYAELIGLKARELGLNGRPGGT